VAFEDAVFT